LLTLKPVAAKSSFSLSLALSELLSSSVRSG
jgi:hypothetical protein